MRISVDPDDRAYSGDRYYGATVRLNGLVLYDCITADEELGEVVVFKRDEAGKLVPNEHRDGMLCEALTGAVTIQLPEVGRSLNPRRRIQAKWEGRVKTLAKRLPDRALSFHFINRNKKGKNTSTRSAFFLLRSNDTCYAVTA